MKRLIVLAALLVAAPALAQGYRARLPQDELIYVLLPDRFENGDPANDRDGLPGGPLQTGFDPTRKGFYHGGDLKRLTKHISYVQALGATMVPVEMGPGRFRDLAGSCPSRAVTSGSLTITLPAFGYAACGAESR